MLVRLEVNNHQKQQLRSGMTAEVRIEALPGQILKVTIEETEFMVVLSNPSRREPACRLRSQSTSSSNTGADSSPARGCPAVLFAAPIQVVIDHESDTK